MMASHEVLPLLGQLQAPVVQLAGPRKGLRGHGNIRQQGRKFINLNILGNIKKQNKTAKTKRKLNEKNKNNKEKKRREISSGRIRNRDLRIWAPSVRGKT